MRYGDLLAKLASGQQLSPGEQGELRLEGNKQETAASQVAGWTDGAGQFDLNSPLVRGGGTLPYTRMGLATQAIATSSWTALTFDSISFSGSPPAAAWNSADPTQIRLSGRATYSFYQLFGCIAFASNSSGMRGVMIGGSNPAVGRWIALIPAVNGNQTVVPFCAEWRTREAEDWCALKVYQDSGGNLNVQVTSVLNIVRFQ